MREVTGEYPLRSKISVRLLSKGTFKATTRNRIPENLYTKSLKNETSSVSVPCASESNVVLARSGLFCAPFAYRTCDGRGKSFRGRPRTRYCCQRKTNRNEGGMMNLRRWSMGLTSALVFSGCGAFLACGQTSSQTGSVSLINITVPRTTEAVTYRDRTSTKIDFQGTSLMSQAHGEAKVDARGGRVEITKAM